MRHRILSDTEGGALLETAIALPVLALLAAVVGEMSLLANAKQLANYAAFCAARAASVYGVDSTVRAHRAAALALSPISPAVPEDAGAVLEAFGMPDRGMSVLCGIPGFKDSAVWSGRLAAAFVRTAEPQCSTGTVPGKARRYVSANVTYIHRCSLFPLGRFWGGSGLASCLAALRGLPFYSVIAPAVTAIENSSRWNVPVSGRAVMDYWAE